MNENGERKQDLQKKGDRMDLKDIRKILELMKENELSEFELEDEGFRLAAKRGGGEPPVLVASPAPAAVSAAAAQESAAAAGQAEENNWVDITSPMVGTFYRSASPDSESYVAPGQDVEPGSIVCIIEAMKVMNEIKADVSGIVRKVCVENATPVQFGEVLFKVEPVE